MGLSRIYISKETTEGNISVLKLKNTKPKPNAHTPVQNPIIQKNPPIHNSLSSTQEGKERREGGREGGRREPN